MPPPRRSRVVRPPQGRADPLLPGLPRGHRRPLGGCPDRGSHGLPHIDVGVTQHEHVTAEGRHRRRRRCGLLGARHEVVDEHPDGGDRVRAELPHAIEQFVDPAQLLDHDALARAGRPPRPSPPVRRPACPPPRSASPPPPEPAARAGQRAGGRAVRSAARRRGPGSRQRHRLAVEQEGGRPQREGPPRPLTVLQDDRPARRRPCPSPTTAPHQPVAAHSTTRPGSAGTSGTERRGCGSSPRMSWPYRSVTGQG